MTKLPLPLPLLSLLIFGSTLSAGEVGEFPIRVVTPLAPAQIERLRALVREDPEAAEIARATREEAAPLLDVQPQPLATIHYEGLVNTDPKRIATVKKLREMDDVALLVRHWQASGDPRAAETLRKFVVAWAETYRPTGNDVNENKLYPLFVAYRLLRDTFSPEERERIDAWLLALGALHEKAVRESDFITNRYTKHVRMLAIFGGILGKPEWRETAMSGLMRFVTESLRADGTSYDLERRDTLTYHASALRPVIELAMLSGEQGRELYVWESPKGGSIKKSVD